MTNQAGIPKFALVCPTMLQGLTASQGDIYETELEAQAEHEDLKKNREQADMEDDDDFVVIPVWVQIDGTILDEADRMVTITDADSPAVSEKPADELSAFQLKVLAYYENGEHSYITTMSEVANCGDTMVHFLMNEAHDADGDIEEFSKMLDTALRQLSMLQSDMEAHATSHTPRQHG